MSTCEHLDAGRDPPGVPSAERGAQSPASVLSDTLSLVHMPPLHSGPTTRATLTLRLPVPRQKLPRPTAPTTQPEADGPMGYREALKTQARSSGDSAWRDGVRRALRGRRQDGASTPDSAPESGGRKSGSSHPHTRGFSPRARADAFTCVTAST